MQLNKIFLKFVVLFIFSHVSAQPGMQQLTNAPRITFTINNNAKKKIKFITRDSVNFYSLDKKYSFALSMKEVIYKLSNKKLDSIIQISPICFNSDCPRFKSYEPHFTRDYENLTEDLFAFRLVFGVSERKRKSEPPYFYEYKSTVDINIKYKNKKMLVRLDFTKNLEKHFEEKKINLSINFQEGNFEVTDPLKPEIKHSKKSKI